MSVNELEQLPENIRTLLDSVQPLDPVPEDVRHRSLDRARRAVSLLGSARVVRPRVAGLGLKLAAAFIVAAAAVSAATAVMRARHPQRHAPSVATGSRSEIAPSSAVVVSPAPATVTPIPVPEASSDGPLSALLPAPSAAHSAREWYALELKMLQPARAALARGDYTAALANLAEHQRRFPEGRLSEEREGLRVEALWGAGRTAEATSAAVAFRKRFPGSVLISRMRALQLAP